ncbi:hypothetical protein RJ639_043597 [Escallonia herrerae]|uniref:O-fucosyltransferase family protein n=1 Tax=Escallonia herrerae TaxID=1293975 RepID=A0AA89B3V5_9ASTE|nr:hypothetical protein RJ639_043597 [Escallonia herrerae]
MAVDLRQVMAAFLTVSMFMMLGNMIKRDHFDSALAKAPPTTSLQFDVMKISKQSRVQLSSWSRSPWKENSKALKSCWNKPSLGREQSKGFIIFSLTDGPEYHVAQIADAMVVARYLGATLVLPDIIGKKGDKRFDPALVFPAFFLVLDLSIAQLWSGVKLREMIIAPLSMLRLKSFTTGLGKCFISLDESLRSLTSHYYRKFGEFYDVNKFVRSLDGVIKVAKHQPAEVRSRKLLAVRVPNMVSKDYVAANLESLFRRKGKLRVTSYFPSLNRTKAESTEHMNPYSCLAIFDTLHLQSRLQEVVDSAIEKLQVSSRKSNGQFIAVDLSAEKCLESGATGRKSCYNALEIGQFLMKIGFHRDVTIYVTQSGWNRSLDPLRDIFPNTYTKEDILPEDEKAKLNSQSSEFGRIIDFHICSQSDVFVPALDSLFYKNVIGRRIASGKTQVLVPAELSSASASDYTSPYISKKSHFAYSCFC